MTPLGKTAARDLALAFVRKKLTIRRCRSIVQNVEEQPGRWIFDFYHVDWHGLRKSGQPFGFRISVDKHTGHADHYDVLEKPKEHK